MKKRTVAYVRVSTASKAQLHSYEFQERYWQDKFTGDPDNELIGIYADRGISGRSVYKRPQFLVMMQDARDGKLDVIYTKSVSRFARNTVQLLEAIRELRDLGIEVVFEKEQISTLQPTSEIFLTIAATVAENDLKVDSERQRWSIQHRCENGWISIGNGLYGFRMTDDNNLEIIPEEAEIVRRIFDMYLSGAGCTKIAKTLNDELYEMKTEYMENNPLKVNKEVDNILNSVLLNIMKYNFQTELKI
jgi:DNA invertase Pin-like site-specific DNA recombinase